MSQRRAKRLRDVARLIAAGADDATAIANAPPGATLSEIRRAVRVVVRSAASGAAPAVEDATPAAIRTLAPSPPPAERETWTAGPWIPVPPPTPEDLPHG